MKLPNGDRAFIDPRKLSEYSLNADHDEGKHKAELFRDLLGFTVDNMDLLIEAVARAAASNDAEAGKKDRYGQRFQLDFLCQGPDGSATVRSAWVIRPDEDFPRLVTCYIL